MADDEDKNQSGWVGKVLNFKNAILAIVAVVTAVNTYITSANKNELDVIQAQLDTAKSKLEIQSVVLANQGAEIENDIRKREFANNLKFKLYEEVKNAVTKNEPKTQDVVVLIINEMLADDSMYRTKLNNILLNSHNTDPLVKSNIQTTYRLEAAFTSEQVETKAKVLTAKANNRFIIDIFFLEDSKIESEPLARKVEAELKEKYSEHTIRVRMLPKIVNAKTGYGITTNQIRFERREQKFAHEILRSITNSGSLAQLTGYPVKSKTENYISIFVKER